MDYDKKITHSFPANPNERLHALSQVFNTEIKSGLLLTLGNHPMDKYTIHERFKLFVNETLLPQATNYTDYCHRSLLPAGVISEKETTDNRGNKVFLYTRTPEGEQYGVPVSALALKWSVENNLSMYSILGQSASKGKSKSPSNRIKILRALKEHGPSREADLMNYTSLPQRCVFCGLKALEQIGFVRYESVPELYKARGTFTYTYSGKEGKPGTVPRVGKKLTERIFKIAQERKPINCVTLGETLNIGTNGISTALRGLQRQGYLENTGRFESGKTLSRGELLDAGRKFIDEFVEVAIDALSGENILKYPQLKTAEFLESETGKRFLTKGIENYWEVSEKRNRGPRRGSAIINHLRTTSPLRPSEIEKATRMFSIGATLAKLVEAGILTKITDQNNRKATLYTLT